jgi:small-conductance mechanosensitive channel
MIHHLRRLMYHHPAAYPPWIDVAGRVRRFLGLWTPAADLRRTVANLRQVVFAVGHALPAGIGTAVAIVPLAWCPALVIANQPDNWPTAVLWSGPTLVLLVTLHAWWSCWWQHTRRPRWWPLVLAGGCAALPVSAWMTTFLPVWCGWSTHPSAWWVVALVVWATWDVVYRTWLALGRRMRTAQS